MKKPPTRKITPPWSSSLGDNLDETPTCSRVTLSQGAATRISYVPIAISPGGSTEPACGRGRFVYRWRFARSGNWREKTTYRHDITHQLIPRPSWSEIYGSTSTVTIKEESLLEPCFHKTIHRSLLVGLPKFCVSSRFHGRNPTGMMPKILLDMDSCQWNLSPWATAQTPTAWKPDRTESMSCQRCCKTNTQRSATKCAHNMRVYIYIYVCVYYIYIYLFVCLFIYFLICTCNMYTHTHVDILRIIFATSMDAGVSYAKCTTMQAELFLRSPWPKIRAPWLDLRFGNLQMHMRTRAGASFCACAIRTTATEMYSLV